MEDKKIHSNIIKQVCKEILILQISQMDIVLIFRGCFCYGVRTESISIL